jgi:uracil-DNA glycosylase family 4
MPTSRLTRSRPRAADAPLLPHHAPSAALRPVHAAIVTCERCPRLRRHCTEIARVKRAAFRTETYWGRPVPGFGDPDARVLVVGLAPAAHGGNRTGRVFTGDGAGGSGDFLMAAMHAAGFANQPTSRHTEDGLQLIDAFIAAAVRCAPPDNKPTPEEFARCARHLGAEWDALPNIRVVVALGKLAYDACWKELALRGERLPKPKPAFGHGISVALASGMSVVCAYHPSRQNTHTGKLTAPMLAAAFATAQRLARAPHL